MLKSSQYLRTLLLGAIVALMVGLLGPVSPAVAIVPTVSLTASITGTPTVGQTLTAVDSGTTPSDATLTYKWETTDSSDTLGTASTFIPGSAQIGKQIKVTIYGTATDYDPGEDTSSPTAAIRDVFTAPPSGTVDITNPKVGQVVTVTPSPSTPAQDSYQYDWYRIDTLGVRRVIPGAVNATYTPTLTDLNRRLQVEVTAIKAGYEPRSGFTAATARVNYIALNKTSVARGSTLGVTARQLRAGQTYKIYVDGVSVYKGVASSAGTASRTVTVPRTTGTGTKRVWVSGYNKSGVRDFQVMTTVTVT